MPRQRGKAGFALNAEISTREENLLAAMTTRTVYTTDWNESASALMDRTNISLIEHALDRQDALSQTLTGASISPRRSLRSLAPLSSGQQQVWLLDQLLPEPSLYNECVSIHLPGLLDVTALERSLNEVVRRHEAWRTSFPLVDGQPIQFIHPPTPLLLSVIDLRHLSETERAVEALQRAAEEAHISFDVAQGPLLRATLLRLDDAEYWLCLTLHRIICDGISLSQLFLPELHALYEAFSTGQPARLPTLQFQYADFAVWQRERLQRNELSEHLAYWKQQFKDAPTALELPIDHPRPALPTYRGAIHPFTLSQHLTDNLRILSAQQRVTLFTTLLAAFNTLLYRYTGQDDLLVGTTTQCRPCSGVQHLLGVFDNTLVMRTHLANELSFCELLEQVRTVIRDAQEHADVPFAYLVKEVQPERAMRQHPLFQVLLQLEPPPPSLPSGWTLTRGEATTSPSQFDLSLLLEDRAEGLTGRFEYRTDLFDASTIARMVGHWQTLLESIVVDPTQSLAELPLLTERERHQLLVEWNDTAKDYQREHSLHQLFEAQVERTPQAIAVTFENRHLTYRELNERANRVAHALQRLGIGPDVLVGVYMERSLELVIGLLSILKAGGAYVPLDPTYPKERLGFMLEDIQATVVLTQARWVATLPAQQARVICLDADWESLAHEDPRNPVSDVASDNLAYVIYTSGSTGKPKGAMNTHAGICNRLLWMQDAYQLTATDSVLQKTPFSFDVSVWEFFWPLITGARLVVARPEGHKESAYLVSLIAEQKITTLHFVPSMLQVFLEEPGLEECHSLRQVMCSGEALPFELQERFFVRHPAALHNLYGPTEAAVDVTFWACQRTSERRTVPIGYPIANTQIYLLDQRGHPVPIGIPGELYIGGIGVARGYLNRPELTAERFLPNTFSSQHRAILYKTGDLARYLPDGAIEYLGRLDHQVKIRGVRIELGEIEAVLRQHAEVREAVVMAREDTTGDKRLVAYLVSAHAQTPASTRLREALQEKLPEYMIPSDFVFLDAFALTSSGKVDRRALPAPDPGQRLADAPFVAPTLPIHQQLAQIWEELLDRRPIGITDNFFALGGHSLLAARMMGRIEQVCGKRLPLATLFAGATIEHLADVLLAGVETSSQAPLVAVQTTGLKRPFFYLHGDWIGGSFYCLNLAHYLGPEQPFYVLEPYKFEDLRVLPTFEAMAAAHVESMRTVQPEGPYLLGGFCNGGLLAYEMARQLHAEGQTTDLLVLIDPMVSAPHDTVQELMHRIGTRMHVSQKKQVEVFLLYRYLLRLWQHYWGRLNNTWQWRTTEEKTLVRTRDRRGFLLRKLRSLFTRGETFRQHWVSVFDWVASGYVPHHYAGKIAFLWTADDFAGNVEWSQLTEANDVTMHIIPGTHRSCRGKDLHGLAEQLKQCLSQAQEALPGQTDS